MGLKENYFLVKRRVEVEGSKARLIVVTKNHGAKEIGKLLSLGQKDFGENKLQELEGKAEELEGKEIAWHFIGHLQGNKARRVTELCEIIHSVDSAKLAGKIDSTAAELGKKQKILIEINVSGEESKYGIRPEELENFLNEIKNSDLKNIEVLGLMAMTPRGKAEGARPYFRQLRGLAGKFGLKELSMGMSNDYEVALEEGATMVRVGTKIFECGKLTATE